MGVSFQNIGDTVISIQDVVPMTGFDDEGGDQLRIWNPLTSTYTTVYYYADTYTNSVYSNDLGPGWADELQNRLNITLDPGQGFWLKTLGAASFCIAGEVLDKDSNKISTLANKQDMVSNVFPCDTDLQDVVPVSGFDEEGGDQLRIWNPQTATYATYYYYADTYINSNYLNDLGPGWADELQNRPNGGITIQAGQSFWLKTLGNGVLSFTPPAGI